MSNQLERFPVELLHEIFVYLRAHEIIQAFSNLNQRLNLVLANYDRYILDFRSVRKSQFEFTCRFIQPHQVIALVLSDSDRTIGQCELFFSQYRMEHFTNLRSLEIDTLNESAFKWIHNAKNLLSLKLPRHFLTWPAVTVSTVTHYLPQLYELNQLCMGDFRYSFDRELRCMHHIRGVNGFQAQNIFKMMPNLRSMSVNLGCLLDRSILKQALQLNYLKRLEIYTIYSTLTIADLEQLLIKMPHLIHLELDIATDANLLHGKIWESVILQLVTFNFRFRLRVPLRDTAVQQILDTFCSFFWLEHKQWFVAYDDQDSPPSFFTVPRFAPNQIEYSEDYRPPRCTSSILHLNDYVDHLVLSTSFRLESHFPNVTSLVLKKDDNTRIPSFKTLVDVIRVLPRLISLTFSDVFPLTEPIENIVFDQIRTLHIRHNCRKSHIESESDLKQLCFIYPRVEHLRMSIHTCKEFRILMDTFRYLSSLVIDTCYRTNRSTWPESKLLTHQWLLKNIPRLSKTSRYTCKIQNQTIYLWL